jgi:hypothetical protein
MGLNSPKRRTKSLQPEIMEGMTHELPRAEGERKLVFSVDAGGSSTELSSYRLKN